MAKLCAHTHTHGLHRLCIALGQPGARGHSCPAGALWLSWRTQGARVRTRHIPTAVPTVPARVPMPSHVLARLLPLVL